MRTVPKLSHTPCRSLTWLLIALSAFALGPAAVALAVPAVGDAAAGGSAPAATLDRATVPARAKQSALLTVEAFGRYAITAASQQGVGVQLVDRMAGAGPVAGEAGKQDGRLDVFLDRGEHKVVTHAAERGSGEVALTARAFRELNARPPRLVEQRLERSTLGDFEQRSYWLEITEKRFVALEAAGRHLADLRLWRDGVWLVEAAPQLLQGQGRHDQPLAIARLTVELEPGLYLLSAYGGPSQPWTEDAADKPFLLRFGIPTLGPAMRRQLTMSEFGTDRFLVPEGPNFFRLELPSAHDARLQVDRFDAQQPFAESGSSGSIDKRALPPVVELDQRSRGPRVVSVSMAPGKTYVLQHFERNWRYRFSGTGDYWISSIHAGTADDSVGATAVLTRQPRRKPEELVDDRAIDLGDAWHRRFNLLDELTLFVRVPHPTAIRVVGDGVRARYRLEPFLTTRPADYRAPDWESSGHIFPVLGGLYVLTIAPETRGILDLHLLPGFSGKREALTPVSAAARFAPVRLDAGTDYTLYINQQPGVAAGAIVRPLPIDLRESLPVAQLAGETLTIPVAVPEPGTLRARTEDGRVLELTLDNGKAGAALVVDPGRYRITVRAPAQPQTYVLSLEPTRLASTTPLPPVPDSRLATLPKFPVISADAPHHRDLERESQATYAVRVDRPGLYQFESTGLLHTGGKVRTRVNPALFAASRNGVGGNFMIQRYLREGDYQLTVATEGRTQGHLGVQLRRSDVIDGGELREGEVARAALPPGSGLAYRFRIAQPGRYRLQALGLGRQFDVRLEDDAGWPVQAPLQSGDLELELAAGDYRLLVMPQTAEARVLTRLERIAEAKQYTGHGPHRIALDTPVSHTWTEPAKGRARVPDQWEFVLPAPAQVTITLDSEMAAELVPAGDPAHPLARVDATQPWRGELAAGRYQVRARSSRQNNFVAYSVQVAATQLLAGASRTVSAPATIPVSVGGDGLVELESFGRGDVRARLFDAAGEVVAQDDDRAGDWNFQIARRLAPGQYRLQVDPVNEKRSATTITMRAPREVSEKPMPFGSDVELRDAHVHVYPLPLPATGNVLLVSARSSDATGLALEGESPTGWVSLGTELGHDPYLVLPLAERFSAYRLRAWSADRRSQHVTLRAVSASLPAAPESRWVQGAVAPQVIDAKRPELRVALVELERPGSFRLAGAAEAIRWSDRGTRAAADTRGNIIAVGGKSLWLAREDAASGGSDAFAAERLRLPVGDQDPLRLELMPGQLASVDVQPNPAGPSLVIAEARAGQPGVAAGETRDPAAIGFVPGASVTYLAAGATAPVRLWNAGDPAAALELDVRQVALRPGEARSLAVGPTSGALKPRTAVAFKLPGEPVRVRLTLSPMSAAVFVRRDRPLSTHWAGNDALQEGLVTDADWLWLVNAAPDEAQYGVELAANGRDTEAPLRPGELFERNLGAAGRLRVPVALPTASPAASSAATHPDAAYHLRVRGNARAMWQDDGGRIISGNDLAIRAGGVLWIDHRPGTVVAWLDEPAAQGDARIDRWRKAFSEVAVSPPQTLALNGRQQLLGLRPEQPVLLHLRSSMPVVSQFVLPGQPPITEAHLNGASANRFAPGGPAWLMLRVVGAATLSGEATITATPAIPLKEGSGSEVLVASGDAQLFAFELTHPATVGLGVRASADVIRAVLYDARGTVVSEGVVQMPTLTPGRYFLVVDLPPDNLPVRVQPIVLGLDKPDTRPPYDILRRYVEATDGDALLYVPPPPAPPPAAATGETDAAGQSADEPVEADPEADAGGLDPEADAAQMSDETPAEEEE